MSDTRVADVLDELYDLLVAEPVIAAAIAAGTLAVFDGSPINDFSALTMLVVGGIPMVDESAEISVSWDWGSLGRSGEFADIDEWIDVPCAVKTVDGDAAAIRTARRTAITFYAKAASAIRGTTLGIGQVMWCTCAVASITQEQTDDGAEVTVSFIARIRTRI